MSSEPDYERLADRLNDAWAVLRRTPEAGGTGLADDVLEAAQIIRSIPVLIDEAMSRTQDHAG